LNTNDPAFYTPEDFITRSPGSETWAAWAVLDRLIEGARGGRIEAFYCGKAGVQNNAQFSIKMD